MQKEPLANLQMVPLDSMGKIGYHVDGGGDPVGIETELK
jgi:hypothetical protein